MCTFFDHSLPTSSTLLGRLEDELHCAFQLSFPLLQQLGTPQQHRHMAVMSTCMGLAVDFAPAQQQQLDLVQQHSTEPQECNRKVLCNLVMSLPEWDVRLLMDW